MKKALGKSCQEGMTIVQLIKMFPNDEKAREWFEKLIWPDGPKCPYCGSGDVQSNIKHHSMTHRCRVKGCDGKKKMFSLKIGTVMQGSKLGYQDWAVAIYLLTTSLKAVSSMKLHRDIGVTQKTAWHLAHRLRRAHELDNTKLVSGFDAG